MPHRAHSHLKQMLIKNFIESYKNCPFCGEELTIEGESVSTGGSSHTSFTITAEDDRLNINVKSDYFVSPRQNSFDFTISVTDGQIISCDQTNQFVSLYDLEIILKKECTNCCRKYPGEVFSKHIEIHYDRVDSSFVSRPLTESFGIADEDNYYYFCNNFKTRSSFLTVQPMGRSGRNSPLNTPYIPFEKFDFTNRERLLHKLQSIQLLR